MNEKIWYSFKGKSYAGQFPPFFDPDQFAWASGIEHGFPVISRELNEYIGRFDQSFEPYFNTTLVEKLKSWKTSNFIFWGRKNLENCRQIPETMRIFEQIPGLASLGISVLDAHAQIKPHEGDTNAIIRCHLGLDIPAPAPACALKVKNETRGWKKGRLTLFCDAWQHQAWNNSEHPRYVLIFDVIHPAYISKKKQVYTNVRSWLDLQRLDEKIPCIKNAPGIVRALVRQWLKLKYIW